MPTYTKDLSLDINGAAAPEALIYSAPDTTQQPTQSTIDQEVKAALEQSEQITTAD